VQGNMSQELSRAGFAEMSSDAMQNFLSSKSEVEMDSYFSMQKTALQVAMENITGHGSQTERKKSQDTYVIGTFNKWAGSAGDSNDQFVASHVFANDQILGLGFNSFLTGGFGELGSGSARPGGAPYGFYVQLALSGYSFNQEGSRRSALAMGQNVDMSDFIGKSAASGAGLGVLSNAGALASSLMTGNYTMMATTLANMGSAMASGAASSSAIAAFTSLSPVSTMINQFDPVAMLATSKYNVDYGHDVLGKGEGYMWEANALANLKQPMVTAGAVMVNAALADPDFAISKPLLGLIGSLLVLAGNSINVNPTTGERLIKMTDQGVINSAIAIVCSVIIRKTKEYILKRLNEMGFSGKNKDQRAGKMRV